MNVAAISCSRWGRATSKCCGTRLLTVWFAPRTITCPTVVIELSKTATGGLPPIEVLMGGNALKDVGVVRLPARLYAVLAERVVARLTDGVLFPGLQARAIPALRAEKA